MHYTSQRACQTSATTRIWTFCTSTSICLLLTAVPLSLLVLLSLQLQFLHLLPIVWLFFFCRWIDILCLSFLLWSTRCGARLVYECLQRIETGHLLRQPFPGAELVRRSLTLSLGFFLSSPNHREDSRSLKRLTKKAGVRRGPSKQ